MAARMVHASPIATAREGRPPLDLVRASAPEGLPAGPVRPVLGRHGQVWVPAVLVGALVAREQGAVRPVDRGCGLWERARWRLAPGRSRAARMAITVPHPAAVASVAPLAPAALRVARAVPVVLQAGVGVAPALAGRAAAEPAAKSWRRKRRLRTSRRMPPYLRAKSSSREVRRRKTLPRASTAPRLT